MPAPESGDRAPVLQGGHGHALRREQLLKSVEANRGAMRGLRKDTSNLFRDPARVAGARLDVREFNHVLAVDPLGKWIDAEGMTTYEDLVAASLAHRLLPPVVPELKTITLGGAAAGVGIEASSFRYGLVHETLTEIDVLTGAGRILTCRADNEHSDLFHGFPNSYGTLGYALRLRTAAIAARPFVELTHRRYPSARACFDAVAGQCQSGADFVDGVVFGAGAFYLNTGRFVESAPWVSDYTFEHIYYRSIPEREIDYLSIADFIWRWDTDWFWCSKNVGAQIPWIRRLYGRKRLGSRTYQRVMRFNSRWGVTSALGRLRGGHTESVIQDVDIPIANAPEFVEWFRREIGILPIWICPLIGSPAADRFPLYPLQPRALYVNFGFWDVVRRQTRYAPHHFNRLVEDKVGALGGIKSLYSDSFYERDAFDRIYGGDAYRALKAKYDPDGDFPALFDKCVTRR